MAFQCTHCGDHLIGSPDQEQMSNVCDECYKEYFKSEFECTCTEHDMCSFCQNPPHDDDCDCVDCSSLIYIPIYGTPA